jgi:hypothetical protein
MDPRKRNWMFGGNNICSANGWVVGGQIVGGVYTFKPFRTIGHGPNTKYIYGTIAGFGKEMTQEEADKVALAAGVASLYGRNVCGFVSSRAYRKHTGRTAVADKQRQYDDRVARAAAWRARKAA